ncbi:MAG: uroporphyrinogen-III decarboxylase [Deltaproteobacteria bacterium]|nr:uroporphyrinogen-III decarboxylase [Deltaproteobacteria bacterium]
MTKTKAELFAERQKRFDDVLALRVPDRVPIMVSFGFLPAFMSGMTIEEVMYDPEKLWEAQWKCTLEFEPDMEQNPYALRFIGPLLESLDYKQLQWPGHGVGPNIAYQFVEGEYMKAEEYDHLLLDPSDFVMRRYLPRICGRLKALENLPQFSQMITPSLGLSFGFIPFQEPEVIEAMEALREAGVQSARIAAYSRRFSQKAKEEGFPMQTGSMTQAPFDTLGDYFRGTRGLMLDMYRRPKDVIQACEKLLPLMFQHAVNGSKASGNPRVFIPIHKGLDGFMSGDQFKKFFWPTLRDLMNALINEGLTPCPFWEGNCTSRLEIIRDIPAAKACYKFEATDMFKAKEVLKDVVCIRGNVPLSILIGGTPDDVRAYCRKLIDVAGKDGGFIMDAATGLDDAQLENIRALFDVTRAYGGY